VAAGATIVSVTTAATAGQAVASAKPAVSSGSVYTFQGSWIMGPQRDSWTLSSAQGALDDGCCETSSTTLAADAAAGSTTITPAGYKNLFPGDSLTIGTGSSAQTVTVTAAGPSPAGSSTTAVGASAGASNVSVGSAVNFVVGAPITVGSGASAQHAIVSAVGTAAGSTTLFSTAQKGDTQLYVSSLSPLNKNTELVLGSGASAQVVTVTGTNGAAPAATALAAAAAAGDTTIYLNSVTGIAPEGPLVLGSGSSAITVHPKYVSTAAGSATPLLSAAAAGATTVDVGNDSGYTAGLPALIGGQKVTVESTTPAVSTTLAAAAAQGDTDIKLASVAGLVAGGTLSIGTCGRAACATATIASVGTAGASGTGVTLTAGLSAAQASGVGVTSAGTGITFRPALTSAEPAGASAEALGGGIVLSKPLGASFAAGSAVQGAGLGIQVSPPLKSGVVAGTSLMDEGEGIGFTPALTSVVPAGTSVTAGTGVTVSPALKSAFTAGTAITSTPADFCRPVSGNADNQGSCQEVRPAPLLRKSFDVAPKSQHGKVVNAELYYSGLGSAQMSMNGSSVSGADRLDPAFTNYSDTVDYQTKDVTSLITQSGSAADDNVIGAELGSGQFDDDTDGGNWGWVIAPWRSTPELLANLWITYADGTRQLVKTDPSWQVSLDGPTRYDGFYVGEDYDARYGVGAWDTAGYTAEQPVWQPALKATAPLGTLTYQT
jgi:hypothetical protein